MILGKENLDALLREWNPPGGATSATVDDDVAAERSDKILKAALAAPAFDADVLAALLEAPSLPAEPGEPGGESSSGMVVLNASGGEKTMSRENEPGGSTSSGGDTTAPPTSASVPPAERKRTSLKAIAERASQSGARPSSPSTAPRAPLASQPPGATVTPLPGRPSSPRISTVPTRPAEAGSDDSGVVNLQLVKESATPAQIAAAEKAKPGTADLFEEDKPAAAKVAPVVSIAKAAPAAEAKKSNTGAIAGIAIAVLGIAAAFAIMQRKPAQPAPTVADSKPVQTVEAKPTAAPTAAPAPTVAAADPAATAEPSAAPDSTAVAAAPKLGGPLPASAGTGTAAAPTAAPSDDPGKLALAKPAAPTGKPGDLHDEIVKAAGGSAVKDSAGNTPEPAAGGLRNQNIPEQPSQGAAQAAVRGVIGGAKACVAGASDVSRADVTFKSNGTVSNVAVSGWAAANGKAPCIKAALQGATVGPFSKPSFSIGFPIRP